MKSVVIRRSPRRSFDADDLELFDDDVAQGHVLEPEPSGYGNTLDLVHDLQAFDHFAEHAITPTGGCRRCVIEEIVVDHVDEELAGRRVRIARARHGDAAALV